MLVLLVVMILSLPTITHKVPIDLPTPDAPVSEAAETHRLGIAGSGALSWDGAVLGEGGLRARLDALVANPNASLQVAADPRSRYEVFDRTLATVKRAGVTRLGFVGNDRYRDFAR